jgi:hypothetical protein
MLLGKGFYFANIVKISMRFTANARWYTTDGVYILFSVTAPVLLLSSQSRSELLFCLRFSCIPDDLSATLVPHAQPETARLRSTLNNAMGANTTQVWTLYCARTSNYALLVKRPDDSAEML